MVNDEHEPIRELSGAAALRALTPDEARLVAAHLAECAACRAEFAELRETAELLLRAPEPIRPPPELRSRVMAAIALETRRPDGPVEVPAVPIPLPRAPTRKKWDWRELGLVASLALALFFGYWTARLSGEVAGMSAQLQQQQALVRAATD